MARIAPSILSADYAALATEIAKVEPAVDRLHVDVMDGHFVPNITIGAPVIKSIRKVSGLYFDCHLMITNPGDYLETFKKAGANGCSVHVEVGETPDLIRHMRDLGLDAGMVVNPGTPFDAYEEYLDMIDMVVIMTVNPGFGGQSFMTDVMTKLRQTRDHIERHDLRVAIEVDGGIDLRTAPVAAAAGADTFVAGNAIFGASDPRSAAEQLREVIESVETTRA